MLNKNTYRDRHFILMFICSFFFSTINFAQKGFIKENSLKSNSEFIIQVWNSENGLPQNSINGCKQTSDGFIWIYTRNGLSRFDGNAFDTYNTKNTKGLEHNNFKSVYEDKNHNLWFISIDNKLTFYSKGLFKHIELKEDINNVCENKNGEIILSSINGEIFNYKKDSLLLITKINNHFINKLLFDDYFGLLIASDKGLYQYKNNKVTFLNEFGSSNIFMLEKDLDNKIWVNTRDNLFKIDNERSSIITLPASCYIDNIHPTKMFIVNEHEIWVTKKNGVYYIKNNTCALINKEKGLSSEDIIEIIKDKQNNIWVCTANAGINKLHEKIIKTYTKEDGIVNESCIGIIKRKDNTVLIANQCAGITEWKNNIFKRYDDKYSGCVWSIFEDKSDNLWVGSYYQGLYKIKNNISNHYYYEGKSLENAYLSVFEDSKNRIWLGTLDGIYTYINGVKKRFLSEKINGEITCFFEDSKKRIWFCSNKGLGLIDNENVKLYTVKDGLSHNKVRNIYEDEEGVYWIATYGGGINRLKENVFFSFNKTEKIINDETSCILEDKNKNFWISSNNGIYVVPRDNLNAFADNQSLFISAVYLGKEDGMLNTECNGGSQNSGIMIDDKLICFPTINGLAVVNSNKKINDNYIPTITIKKIVFDSTKIFVTDSVYIAPLHTKKIQIEFTAPYFNDLQNLRLKYRLINYENTWNEVNDNRKVEYLNLPPGEYIFQVAVYGFLNYKQIKIIVQPPFWQTNIFYIIIISLLLILISIFTYLISKKVSRDRKTALKMKMQFASLELKALQGQMNPHFIFNCLNTIKYFIEINDNKNAGKYLKTFSILIRMFLDQSNSNTTNLENEIKLISLYIEMEQLRVSNSFEFICKTNNIEYEKIEIPTMLIQPFVENAIHHGLRNSNKKGLLILNIDIQNNFLYIIIEDNGIGRNKSKELKEKNDSHHNSVGMKISEERVNTFNYIMNTFITIQIEDKVDANQNSEGTKIIIKIPLI
jgi:ligand-binding sensor domain-containing protein/anti-sigma regulatory factor (Ser/Thr protein kinase)